MPDQVSISWGGIAITAGFDFTFGPGIEPSTCALNSPPHEGATMVPQGNLVIQYAEDGGAGFTLTFPDCRLERPRLSIGGAQMWQLPIRDRRWKWAYGHVSGSYNVRQPDDSLLREKTPQELATLLFEAMGESGFDVGQLPNNARPEVAWDYSNPAQELAALADSLGCIVVLNPLTNKAELWPIGTGADSLPDLPRKGGSVGFSVPAKPSKLTMVGAPVLFAGTFAAGTAVGMDIDGRIKHIDELSYMPSNGWSEPGLVFDEDSIPGTYEDPATGEQRNICDLAAAWIWRAYRIEGLQDGTTWSPPLLLGTPDQPDAFEDIELLSEQVAQVELVDGSKRRRPAECLVIAYGINEFSEEEENTPKIYRSGFSIDTEEGLVVFSQPEFQLDENGSPSEAVVELWTSFRARKDGVYYRHTKTRDLDGSSNTEPRVEIRDELAREIDGDKDNVADVNTKMDYYLDAIAKEYDAQDSATARYVGIVPISIDGKVRQITWSKSSGGIWTQASIAREHNRFTPSFEDSRRKAKESRSIAKINRGEFERVAKIMEKQGLI